MGRNGLLCVAALMAVSLAACGGGGGGGLSVLGGASPAASPSASTSSSATPSGSPSVVATATPSPSISGTPSDPFGRGELTAADIEAYVAEVKPLAREIMRVQNIAGDMLVEVSAVPDDSWDTAAERTDGYAEEIARQGEQWDGVMPPPALDIAHKRGSQSIADEVEMLTVLAGQLRDRTWNVVRGTRDVNKLGRKFRAERATYMAEIEGFGVDHGVTVSFRFE